MTSPAASLAASPAVVGIIPARYGSSRFEGKPLALIEGRPMIEWVARRAARAPGVSRVIVALDDDRVAAACQAAGIEFMMTRSDHGTSTGRLAEVAAKVPADLYIAINGDEPLIDPNLIARVIPEGWPRQNGTEWPADKPFAANLTCRMTSPAEVVDPSNIKVVWGPGGQGADTGKGGRAVFFSRSPIPYPKSSLDFDYYKHIGVIAYNRAGLDFFASTPKGPIEAVEDINELRFIENGVMLQMIVVEPGLGLSVDTPKDLERIRALVREKGLQP